MEKVRSKTKKWSNMKEQEKEGLNKIKERIKGKEVICYVTDKSGRWTCDTISNYEVACRKRN